MAAALAEAGVQAIYSFAGRTQAPPAPPLPHRVGGFGGVAGLTAFLRERAITHVIDATHPFAAEMSRNAIAACASTGTHLIALERVPWAPGPGDDWQAFSDFDTLARALPAAPTAIFLAIGRQNLAAFAARDEHRYLLRLVDAPEGPAPLPGASVVVSKGPFTLEGDLALMRAHGIRLVVAKNAGGEAARAKLDAARALGLPVWLVDRPDIPPRPRAETPAEVMDWLAAHPALRGE